MQLAKYITTASLINRIGKAFDKQVRASELNFL